MKGFRQTGFEKHLVRTSPVMVAILALTMSVLGPSHARSDATRSGKWIAAWGAALTSGTEAGPADATVRNIARMTIGGEAIKVRLSNALGEEAIKVGAAYVGIQKEPTAPDLVPGSVRRLTFDGRSNVKISPKVDFVESDPVSLDVDAQQNVAVSLYLPKAGPDAAGAAWNTSYASEDGSGNRAAQESGEAFTVTRDGPFALTEVVVLTDEANGAVVGLGSSSFHGSSSTRDAYATVLDGIAERINKEIAGGRQKSIVRKAFGGDTLHAAFTTRFKRDVLKVAGVSGVILYDINDLAIGMRNAQQVMDEYKKIIRISHAHGIRVFCPTWPPALHGSHSTAERYKLNAWIMNSGACDGVVDWDAVLRWEEGVRILYRPDYFADGIHPNDAGHHALAEATPMSWFRRPLLRPRTTR